MNAQSRSDFDKVLSALSDPYRRKLLVALLDHTPQDVDPLELTGDDGEQEVSEIELVHVHLPKLDDMGYIRWEPDTGEISRGPNWDEITPLLELIHTHRDELPDGWV